MCNTYVKHIGYICYECQEEFKEYLIKKNIKVNTEYEIHQALDVFTDIEKDSFTKDSEISIDDFFEKHS